MKKLISKIENWLWIGIFIAALLYFHWLLGELHLENGKLEDAQEQNKQIQIRVEAQLREVTQNITRFLQSQSNLELKD